MHLKAISSLTVEPLADSNSEKISAIPSQRNWTTPQPTQEESEAKTVEWTTMGFSTVAEDVVELELAVGGDLSVLVPALARVDAEEPKVREEADHGANGLEEGDEETVEARELPDRQDSVLQHPFDVTKSSVLLLLGDEVGLQERVLDETQEDDPLRGVVHALRLLDHPAQRLQSLEMKLGIEQRLHEVG